MKALVIDTENSGALRNKAHPFDPRNRMCLFGGYDGTNHTIHDIEYSSNNPYGLHLSNIQRLIRTHDILVGFNIKYDLHWLRRYGINIEGKKIWDCQLAEFILDNQKTAYPSLSTACVKRSVTLKSDTLNQYLEKNVDVDGIPLQELKEYLHSDLVSTHELYTIQRELIKPYWNLFNTQCQDLLVLQEMEYNGLKYDLQLSREKADECLEEEQRLKLTLRLLVPCEYINWSSNDHLSAVLYGGTITHVHREPDGVYKTGQKIGQTKYKLRTEVIRFPRLVQPLSGSQCHKPGYWSVAEPVLKELHAKGKARSIIDIIGKITESEKVRSTYFEGIPKRFIEKGWQDSTVHGQLNQCVAITSRIASSDPNLQNNSKRAKECFISRFPQNAP